MKRREFSKTVTMASGLVGMGLLDACISPNKEGSDNNRAEHDLEISKELSDEMYRKALEITKSKVRGGDSEVFFKKPFIDAAFSKNIFLWDTCFMCCFAKYHMDELPVYQALDNFYDRIENDGFICREYRENGEALWSKNHPVSINPPLLAWAELEIYEIGKDVERLKKVYPVLKRNFQFLISYYQGKDNLFWADTLGMGMDNIPRFPRNWKTDEGNGMTHHELDEKIAKMGGSTAEERLNTFISEYVNTLQGVWNKQGRLVDFSCQMAMLSLQLKQIAELIDQNDDVETFTEFHSKVKQALNELCWNNVDGFYYDLGYGKQIKRRHIGMYWALLGEVVPEEKLEAFIAHLTDPGEFYRKTPLPALSAADPDYVGWGDYWLGGVWAPTVYMVLKGLTKAGKHTLARDLAKIVYKNVSIVFEATGTLWENYAPDLISYGMPAKKDFCGWTALIPISIYKEYIL